MPIDMSAAKAPPVKRSPRTPSATSRPQMQLSSDRDRRHEGLVGLGQLGQGICLMTGQYADAAAIGQHFDPLARELAALADEYEVLAKPVDMLIQVGPFGALLAAAIPFTLQILVNHKVIDASRVVGANIQPPELLEAQMKAQVLRAQAEAQRIQHEAAQETMRLQREISEMNREMDSTQAQNAA